MFETRRERNWAIYAGLVIMVITTIPYCIAYSINSDMVFSGFFIGVEDGNSYIAKMLSGAAGEWLFKSPYTTSPQDGFLAFFPYILLGKLSSPPARHDQLLFLFHFFRFLAGLCLTAVTYQFCSVFLKNIRLRQIATLISMVGGGLGWIALFAPDKWFGQPLEFYSPETFGFLSVLGLPHLLAAKCLLLLGLIFFLKPEPTWKNRISGGLCWLMVGFFQPLTIVTGWAYVGAYLLLVILLDLFRNKFAFSRLASFKPQIISALIIVVISSPWVLYNFLSFSLVPYLSGWASQNLILSPPIWDYLLTFSMLIPFVLIGLWNLLRKSSSLSAFFPAAVILSFPLLAYAPYDLQRRLPDGIWLALIVMALSAFENKNKEIKITVPHVLLSMSLIAPLIILANNMIGIMNPSMPVFRPGAEVQAFEYIAETASKGDVVLASYETSNALPAWAPVRVLAGLGPESVSLPKISSQVSQYFSGNQTYQDQMDMITDYSIDFVFYGPNEQKLGNWDSSSVDQYIRKIYERGGYTIYRVLSAENTAK